MPEFFDEAWLQDYLRKHPSVVARMAEGVPAGNPAPSAGPGGDPDEPEGVLLAKVRRLALANSFLTYHTHDSRKSESGFPDLLLAKPGRLALIELKSRTGKLTQEQAVWLDVLRHSIPALEVYEWRPHDWPDIEQILRRSS